MRKGRWYSSARVAKYTRGELAGESALPPPTWKGGPAALGLGPVWLGTRWPADVAERTFRSFLKPALQKDIQRLAILPQDQNLPVAPCKHRSASERI